MHINFIINAILLSSGLQGLCGDEGWRVLPLRVAKCCWGCRPPHGGCAAGSRWGALPLPDSRGHRSGCQGRDAEGHLGGGAPARELCPGVAGLPSPLNPDLRLFWPRSPSSKSSRLPVGPVLPRTLGTAHPPCQPGQLILLLWLSPGPHPTPPTPGRSHTEEGVAGPGLSEVREMPRHPGRRDPQPLCPVCSLRSPR